ncbi:MULTISPECIES: D-alanyl-D-alanine carboxypeptidase family protein [Streptomycetaceae]|uniref:D-alanyl-D-alanine carboxypeptidase n=1 Tax=Streptantibioticus cattleyicolor (strain ATCC 35852 / DSM 46488 / JCM 4925 / NBRC 14057 / NRRL 8057) TaxID=1003195 RepID=F8K302_STREN|nr:MULTISPECIES: serine hydrolase [Streptomycetaceae]AEW92491.1 D-alanyl-D-alanine carboxypeptidase [Streptantibioticus cattleyicolor NRRL 8057 = DSM 46488]MYS57294.1 D-alanyl-D-alanine carboxypeptidase [Streptomyces sp. SID5468]CCB72851.1 D-alanyl-D-alanine carboxypeptidase [Streptantibioticus cattleyicolor NRRL 8057 = DSM 46488]
MSPGTAPPHRAGPPRRVHAARRAAALAVVSAATAALVTVPAAGAHAASPAPPRTSARGGVLVDTGTGRQLWDKGADTARPMASTTKVMTALVVLDRRDPQLGRLVTVKRVYRDYVARMGASTADLRTGDKLTVRQLLYGTMLPSGCDAAYALADAFGSGRTIAARVASFIARMNAEAARLGLRRTHFDSFDGISQHGTNHASPRDLVRLTRYAMGNSLFRTLVRTPRTVQRATDGRVYTWYNTNRLVGSYPGAIGVKTGSGTAAGLCLVFAATRGGRTVVGVLLGDNNRFPDAEHLLDWAFGARHTSRQALPALPAGLRAD